jgi:hypothetical protein
MKVHIGLHCHLRRCDFLDILCVWEAEGPNLLQLSKQICAVYLSHVVDSGNSMQQFMYNSWVNKFVCYKITVVPFIHLEIFVQSFQLAHMYSTMEPQAFVIKLMTYDLCVMCLLHMNKFGLNIMQHHQEKILLKCATNTSNFHVWENFIQSASL